MAEGIEVRTAKDGTRSYRAWAWDNREGRKVRKTFPSLAAAKGWRSDMQVGIRTGRVRATTAPTLDVAIDQWCDGARDGSIRTRGRRPFKATTTRAVEQHYRRRVKDEFGRRRLDAITLPELQEYVDKLAAKGVNPSTIEGAVLPLRLVYRWARGRGIVAVDPTDGLELPEKGRRTRLPPSPADAWRLLEAVPEGDRALWATAMLAGLRRGELMALRWEDVDLKAGTLRVERSYQPSTREFVTPKSAQGVRTVPVTGMLAPYLRSHQLRTGRRLGLVFGATATGVFRPEAIHERARKAWGDALEHVTLHQCRHLYASMSIAAGVNAHALCRYMGHSGIQVTYDLYGHLFPGNEAEAAALLDAFLERSFAAKPATAG